MNILEKEIEEIIFKTAQTDNDALIERGLYLRGTPILHPDLGDYGIPDIITYHFWKDQYCAIGESERKLQIQIIELKKECINISTLLQAIRYYKGINTFIDERWGNSFNIDIEYEIILIGKYVDKRDDFIYIPDLFRNIKIYTYKIDLINGITFKSEHDYSLINSKKIQINNIGITYSDIRTEIKREFYKNEEDVL